MSKISDAVKECRQFTELVAYRIKEGPKEANEEALLVANAYINCMAEALDKIRRNPFGIAMKIAFGGGWDPFKEVRRMADDFMRKWKKPE